jgi:hypothetical protein
MGERDGMDSTSGLEKAERASSGKFDAEVGRGSIGRNGSGNVRRDPAGPIGEGFEGVITRCSNGQLG